MGKIRTPLGVAIGLAVGLGVSVGSVGCNSRDEVEAPASRVAPGEAWDDDYDGRVGLDSRLDLAEPAERELHAKAELDSLRKRAADKKPKQAADTEGLRQLLLQDAQNRNQRANEAYGYLGRAGGRGDRLREMEILRDEASARVFRGSSPSSLFMPRILPRLWKQGEESMPCHAAAAQQTSRV